MTITATGTPSPDSGTVPVPTFPFSVFDPVHLTQDDHGEPVYVAWAAATCLSAANPAAARSPRADSQEGHLYLGEMDRYADRLDDAATNDDAAK